MEGDSKLSAWAGGHIAACPDAQCLVYGGGDDVEERDQLVLECAKGYILLQPCRSSRSKWRWRKW